MKGLLLILNEFERHIEKHENLNPKISNVSVGWHIEHTLLATIGIIDALNNSLPTNYKRKFNFNKFLVYSINKIPRGRGKAPKSVIPEGNISKEKLLNKLHFTKSKIDELKHLSINHYFNHPYFGQLNLKETIKFLDIHANHHFKIINEILKS